jgi:hypothetical protein
MPITETYCRESVHYQLSLIQTNEIFSIITQNNAGSLVIEVVICDFISKTQ